MDKNFMIRCLKCRWGMTTTGLTTDLQAAGLVEQPKGCVNCGGPRKFRCPRCGLGAVMKRIKAAE